MARYKLGVWNKKEGRIINLDGIISLKNLKTLDEFTTAFNNENELKVYLFNQGLISNYELNQSITIMYKYDGKVKKLPIFYQDMKKYLDLIHLRYELKGLSSNLEFLEKLANYYSNGSTSYNKQGLNVSAIRHYLNDARSNGGYYFYSNMLETTIEDLFKKAIVREINRDTGEIKEDYRGMRDLALFILKFKKQQEKKKEKEELKKLDTVWQQPTLFDIFNQSYQEKENTNNQVLNDGEEPYFPFNSEEEKNFLRQLENLPNEEHPHYRR